MVKTDDRIFDISDTVSSIVLIKYAGKIKHIKHAYCIQK